DQQRKSTPPVVEDPAAAKPGTKPGNGDVVAYLEQKLAAANQRVMELENVLLMYREYAVGLDKLTKSVFAEGEGNADRTG
ncbi:MAG: hypothetical protein M5U25_21180, partial [Planctomycetota bacterium]|nr:hypothetical protein [Planctomycetota bacterium]